MQSIRFINDQSVKLFIYICNLLTRIRFTLARKQDKLPKDYVLCNVACSPLRAFPDDKSEMVSQILFGESGKILRKKGKNWIKISCTMDGYEGWTDPKTVFFLTEKEFAKCCEAPAYSTDIVSYLINGDITTPVLLGSNLPKFDGIGFYHPEYKYVFNGGAIQPQTARINKEILIKIAKKYLNAPYLWGGRSPFGIDCSGFTQVVFKTCGYTLPRDAYQQAEHGEMVDFVEIAEPCDLGFFQNEEGRITHVGIILENQEIIHASGRVRIDKLDHEGIFNRQTKKYTHRLKWIKRIPLSWHLEKPSIAEPKLLK